MRTGTAVLIVGLAPIAAGHAAQADPQAEALAWLKKISAAAQQLNYTGTFVYQRGNRIETSRITHVVDATGEYEKLETLDGPPREIIRSNDQLTCYYPDGKTVRMEKRSPRGFPAVVPEQLNVITENYTVRKGEIDRVAGLDCQVGVLQPKDDLRYGHSYCADVNSGLPLRARTLNEKNEPIESFAFTQLSIGGNIGKEKTRPSFRPRDAGARADSQSAAEVVNSNTGWVVNSSPAGFRKIMEAKRVIQGKSAAHIVYSDGLAAVSIFIEPAQASGNAVQELTQQGAISIYTRPYAQNIVTTLGETPAATVMRIGNSVTFRGK